jgi:hypothetical protein
MKKRKTRSANYPPETVATAWELRTAGHTVKSISRQLRVPYWTLMDWYQLKTRSAIGMCVRPAQKLC